MPDGLDAHGPGLLAAEHCRSVPRRLRALLDEAVSTGEKAIRLPSFPRDECAAHLNLAAALNLRFLLTADHDDLRAATDQGRAAVARAEPSNALRPLALDGLARALRGRHAVTADRASAAEAARLWREATALPNADVESRLVSAAAWGETALTADLDPDDAVDAFTACLDAYAALAGRGAARSDVERRLARWNGLAGSAAVAAVRAGRPGRALELLEYGRTLMWNRLLDDRSELDGLRLVEPALADEVEMLRAELDVAHADGAGGQVDAEERIAVLDRRWDALVERVRAAGFTDFMRPPELTRLLRRTWRGPVVVLTATSHGSHALVVRPAGVQVVELPGLVLREAVARASAYVDALHGESPDEATLHEVHAWMWDVLAEPVLAALGPVPRVWWCPTGVLGLLPVHAAARAPGDVPGSVLGRVVSSYTASVRSLPVDDGAPVPDVLATGGRMLFVGMGRTPGLPDPHAEAVQPGLARAAIEAGSGVARPGRVWRSGCAVSRPAPRSRVEDPDSRCTATVAGPDAPHRPGHGPSGPEPAPPGQHASASRTPQPARAQAFLDRVRVGLYREHRASERNHTALPHASGQGQEREGRGLPRPEDRHGGDADEHGQHDSPGTAQICTLNGANPALRRHPERRSTPRARASDPCPDERPGPAGPVPA